MWRVCSSSVVEELMCQYTLNWFITRSNVLSFWQFYVIESSTSFIITLFSAHTGKSTLALSRKKEMSLGTWQWRHCRDTFARNIKNWKRPWHAKNANKREYKFSQAKIQSLIHPYIVFMTEWKCRNGALFSFIPSIVCILPSLPILNSPIPRPLPDFI